MRNKLGIKIEKRRVEGTIQFLNTIMYVKRKLKFYDFFLNHKYCNKGHFIKYVLSALGKKLFKILLKF